MEKTKADGVSRDYKGLIEISLLDLGDDEGPNLQCDPGDDGPKAVTCSDIKCLDGGEQGWTSSGAAVKVSTGNDDGDDGGGSEAIMGENRGENTPKKRARRANMCSFRIRETIYHIEINSSLGETYRMLATKAEQREFMIKHGKAKPYIPGSRLWAAR